MKFLLRLLVYPLIGLVLLVVFLLALAGFYLSPQDKLAHADAIAVISGGETQARVAEGAKLYREGYAPVVIFSGAAAEGHVSNALSMSRIAAREGVPTSAALLEERSTTTAENASEVSGIVRERGYHSLILVTSPYHQRRADIEFSRALPPGVKLINHSASDSLWRRSGWWNSAEARNLTFSEISKVAYIIITGKSGSSGG